MCFGGIEVSERQARFDGEPRIQRLRFVREGNSSRGSDNWLVSPARGSAPVVVRQAGGPYYEEQYRQRPPSQHLQEIRPPEWQLNEQSHLNQLLQQRRQQQQQQQMQFRPPPQMFVPPPLPQPFGPPIIHQGNPNGPVGMGHYQDNNWHQNGNPVRYHGPQQHPIRVIKEGPRARMPHHDAMGRRVVRNHSKRREQEYYSDDSDDDSFVRTVDSYESDDSFEARQATSRPGWAKKFRH